VGSDQSGSGFAWLGGRRLVGRMHEQLDELLAARDQMESLLRVVVDIGSDLDLDATLRRIITAARSLTGARYGALGVRAPDGSLASFLYEGIDPDLVAQIGHLPVGKGVLGLLVNRAEVLRVDDLSQHPAAVGFPEYHPPMRAFLGVPILIRGQVYGGLYVTDDRPGHVFSESDEMAARAVASAAAVAIDNARLFERVQASARWTDASREITTTLLSESDPAARPLQLIGERARELTDAEQAIVLIPADSEAPPEQVDTLMVAAAVGRHAAEVLLGQQVPVAGSTSGAVFRTGTPVITDRFRYPIAAFTDLGERSAVVVPLRARDTTLGVLAVARNIDRPIFDADDLALTLDFADHAAVALTLGQAREQARRLSLVADRERIAHDLHDHVIQRLFAVGMDLQGSIARARSPELAARLTRNVDELQSTISEIRATIFDLGPLARSDTDFRHRIQNAITELTEDRDLATTVRILGPMIAVEPELAEHAEAVVIEAISNTVRHSGATSLIVEVAVADELTINVIDNGRGIPADNQRRSALANMAQRAEQLGGSCHITSPPDGGTRVRWTAPLTDPQQQRHRRCQASPLKHFEYPPLMSRLLV